MANLVITSNINRVVITFNDYSTQAGMPSGDWQKDTISVSLNDDSTDVFFIVFGENQFRLSCIAGVNLMVVDSVNGDTPIDNDDLYSKLNTILAEQSNAVFSGLTKITVSTTEPIAPNSGDLWIDIT